MGRHCPGRWIRSIGIQDIECSPSATLSFLETTQLLRNILILQLGIILCVDHLRIVEFQILDRLASDGRLIE